MTTIATISELLVLSQSQYRVYDIGRKIDKISKGDFEKIEHNQIPYPFPSQGHAFIALAFWQKTVEQQYLWFVKLPLDERGLLNQGARNHFIAIIVEALGADLTINPTEQQEKLLSNNPYHFAPSQYKLASLNSIIKCELKQPASNYYKDCKQYLSGELGWNNWQNIGVQGITDFAARINDSQNIAALSKAFDYIHPAVLNPLCTALENEKLPVNIIEKIVNRIRKPHDTDTDEIKSNLLRALASSAHHPSALATIDELITSQTLTANDCITLVARCWQVFTDKNRLMLFLEYVIKTHDIALFQSIFKDLVALPTIRSIVFQCMRDPNRSDAFAHAIGQLFNQAKG